MRPIATIARLRTLLALCIVLLSSISPAFAAPQAVQLPHSDGFVQPFGETRYLLDPGGEMGLDQVLQHRDRFRQVPGRWIDFGRRQGHIWLMTPVTNSADRAGRWMLDLQRQWIDSLQVWKIDPDGGRTSLLRLTANSPLSARPVRSRYITVPLDMEAHETADIVIEYSSRSGSWLPLTFATEEAYRNAHLREERTNWTLNGALAALIGIALALGGVAGWRLALSYCAYALTGGLLVANNEGYLFRFVWPGQPELYDRVNLVLLLALTAAGLYFSRIFTEFAARRSGLDRYLRGLLGLLLAAIPLAAFLPASDIARISVYATVPLGALVYFGIAGDAVRARVLGALPFAIGACALASTIVFAALVLAFPGRYAVTVALDYIHATILIEGLAFLVAIVLRILRIRDELNRATLAELTSTRERLRVTEQLAESQRRYEETRRLAEARRARLASASHDLQQPLVSLRRSLADIGDPGSQERERARAALDYLERLTNEGMAESHPQDPAGEAPDDGKESFPVSIIVANCQAMFAREAEANGMALHTSASEATVLADPVVLMRIASNLVSNALKHSQAAHVTIAAECKDEEVILRISDDGHGFSPGELAEMSGAYSKGEDSEGHGLGLHLVRTLCEEQGIGLEIRSEPGAGTSYRLNIARGQ